jgi:glycyl-tRNA synthetase beta chain
MPELLIELRSEEIPARMQLRAAEDLKRLLTDGLKAAGLNWSRADAFATPRRLALVVDGLPERTPDRAEEIKGPRIDAPVQAIEGFLRKVGDGKTLADCEQREDGKNKVWIFVRRSSGVATADAAREALVAAVKALPWPKSMRWSAHRRNWVRPLLGALAVFEGKPIGGMIDLGGGALAIGATTVGHRFHAPREFAVDGFMTYRGMLREANVILDSTERRERIAALLEQCASAQDLVLRDDPGLLDEVTGLVEWPVVHVGTIDIDFMALPPEVLTTSMRTHQRYFTLLNRDGSSAPRFAVVANIATDAAGDANIVAGNERVLRARLSDAKFFWDQDRKHRLETRLPALAERVFYAGLGSMADKVERIAVLAAVLALSIPGCDANKARRAARLAKADLSTGMVGEFPELQGVMGRYYALADGESGDIAEAIREHYAPQGPGDRCPNAPLSLAISIADKIDTLVGFFTIGEKPTGSKDPFGLRRAALATIRLIVENNLRLALVPIATAAHAAFAAQRGATWPKEAPVAALTAFVADRLKVALREKGVRHDLIDAVFARGGEDDLVRLLARVEALRLFLGSDDGANLLVAYRRASNIVAIEEKKDKARHDGPVDAALFRLDEERMLDAALAAAENTVGAALPREDFTAAMAALAKLRAPVDAFFDKVTVNDPEPELRRNRLRLLSRIHATLGRVADFAKIEG